jgi:F0F1-type ATP synthase delta subunit
MNEYNDDLFTYIADNGEFMEFSIRELINHQFNLRILDDNPLYTKEEKIEFMKSLIEDIEMCITKVENDEEIYCFG